MNDNDFNQIFLDYLQIEQERHREIMATFADILAQHAVMNTKLDEKITAFTAAAQAHNAEILKALAILADVGAAGHSDVLDKIIEADKGMMTKIESFNAAETMGTMTTELVAAITQNPVPKP
jgi:hypothetical protein